MSDKAKYDTSNNKSPILTQRYAEMQGWLRQNLPQPLKSIEPLADDASFRHYYRVICAEHSYVLMDAPPDKEDCSPFVAIAASFQQQGVGVPAVFCQDLEQGFLLLEDLGDTLFLQVLNHRSADRLYHHAFDTLEKIQQYQPVSSYLLPQYSPQLLHNELQIFLDWYVEKNKQWVINSQERAWFADFAAILIENARAQPQVCVHRDFHSRNLMWVDNCKVGVLDFQDAVLGPITYDLVSLVKDCYIAWPAEKIDQWVNQYYARMQQKEEYQQYSRQQFQRWFDLMGLQRHLKCLGIFSRLSFRDQKKSYLEDIPRVLDYAKKVSQRYEELHGLLKYLDDHESRP